MTPILAHNHHEGAIYSLFTVFLLSKQMHLLGRMAHHIPTGRRLLQHIYAYIMPGDAGCRVKSKQGSVVVGGDINVLVFFGCTYATGDLHALNHSSVIDALLSYAIKAHGLLLYVHFTWLKEPQCLSPKLLRIQHRWRKK